MKKTLAGILTAVLPILILAQSYEGTVEFQKKDHRAMIVEIPYAPSEVEDAIAEKMEKMGCRKKESKGYLVYKSAVIRDVSVEPADYMIKVERKSRKDKDESIVYLAMTRGEDDIIDRRDALVNSNIKTFLNGLNPHVEAFHLEREIQNQEEVIASAEKKLKDLKEDQESMEKKMKKLQGDLNDNSKDQEKQQKEIDDQQQALKRLKAQRR